MGSDLIRRNPIAVASLIIAIIGIGSAVAVYHTFNPWIKWLEGWVRDLQKNIDALRTPDVRGNFQDPNLGYSYRHTVVGVVINFGLQPASNVRVTFRWALKAGGFHEEIINYSSIAGRGIEQIYKEYTFTGETVSLSYTVTWS